MLENVPGIGLCLKVDETGLLPVVITGLVKVVPVFVLRAIFWLFVRCCAMRLCYWKVYWFRISWIQRNRVVSVVARLRIPRDARYLFS